MTSQQIDEKLIHDDALEVESSAIPAPSRWGRVAVAAAGAAVVLSRLAGVAHADDGGDDDSDFYFASHKDGAVHDDDTVKSAESPMTVKSATTIKSPETVSPLTVDTVSPATVDTLSPATVDTVSPATANTLSPTLTTANTVSPATVTGDTVSPDTLGTVSANTADTGATANTANTTVGTGIGPLVSQFARGELTSAQQAALAPLLSGGLTAADLQEMSVNEFVHALKAAGLTQDQIQLVLMS